MERSDLMTRRAALGGLGGALAGSSLLEAQQDPFRDHSRVPGMDELTTVTEFEAVAFAKMPRDFFNFMAHGAESEFTLHRNREAYDWVELVPKGVVDVSRVQTATELLGTPMAFPIMTSPTSAHIQLNREAEAATYRGSQAASNTPYIVSDAATLPKDKIAAAGTSPLWFQLYPKRDMDVTKAWADNVQALGGKAVVMTVDQQASYYERTTHDRHLIAAGPTRPTAGAGGRGDAPSAGPRAYRVPGRTPLVQLEIRRAGEGDAESAHGREGHSHRRGREALHRTRFRCGLCFQPRRPVRGLRPFHAGGASRRLWMPCRGACRCCSIAASAAARTY